MPRTWTATLLAALALAACGRQDAPRDLNQLDAELVDNAGDPAVASAVEDPIMTDPALSVQADGRALRNPTDPGQTPIPTPETLAAGDTAPAIGGLLDTPAPAVEAPCVGSGCRGGDMTLGELARLQAARRRGGAPCNPPLSYSFAWAAKLPAELPVYPRARVTEAAGADAPGCRVRVVSFTTPGARGAVTDYYYTRAVRARFSAEHIARGGDHILTGERGGDAYYLILADRAGGGTQADLIVTTAR